MGRLTIDALCNKARRFSDENPVEEPTHSGRFTDLDADKLRGGYYTDPMVARWLCAWAIQTPSDSILEPSCGEGVFLTAAAKHFSELGASKLAIANQITGIEIIEAEAAEARSRLCKMIGSRAASIIVHDDFFTWWQGPKRRTYDAVVGNPPFIRYQSFPEPHRSRGMAIMAELGLKPNRLTNIWVPFVVGAAASLRKGGRLALVLPAELLQVSYAAQLRSFLTDRFERINIVTCNELFFDKAEQEVVLLLADGALAAASSTNACRVTLTETRTLADITVRAPSEVLADAAPKTVHHDHEKWLKYFLSQSEIDFMRELRVSKVATPLVTHATVDVGVVTGKNEFFVLTKDQIKSLDLANKYMVPLVSRSAHLKGARIGKADWKTLAAAGDRVHLLHLVELNGSELSPALKNYIRFGEEKQFHKGYKCSIRTPWYAVPSVWTPDGFLFRQIYDFPRTVHNQVQATSTDTIHRLTCKAKPKLVIANTYTHLTAASAEIEGRSYGGGVLELEPTEAERLLLPTKLGNAMALDECDRLVRSGRLADVLIENDRLILKNQMGLSLADCVTLRGIWVKMRDRRLARRRKCLPPSIIAEAAK